MNGRGFFPWKHDEIVIYNDASRLQAYPEFVIAYEREGPIQLKAFEDCEVTVELPNENIAVASLNSFSSALSLLPWRNSLSAFSIYTKSH